jgi:hypothetical protein
MPTNHIAEIEDPVTGERIVVEAPTEAGLEDKVEQDLDRRYPLPGGSQ